MSQFAAWLSLVAGVGALAGVFLWRSVVWQVLSGGLSVFLLVAVVAAILDGDRTKER